MSKNGMVVRWDDARGFGFIRGSGDGAEVFFHIKAFRGQAAPREGLTVSFEDIYVGGKGPRATAVWPDPTQAPQPQPARRSERQTGGLSLEPLARPRPQPGAAHPVQARQQPARSTYRPHRNHQPTIKTPGPSWPAMLLMLAWSALIGYGVQTGRLPVLASGVAALLNLATFFAYWRDKYAAQKNAWRTPESTLHLFGLLGGWPGAWFAQQILRHKSSKVSFRETYWGTVVFHCVALAAWIFWERIQAMLSNQ